MVTRQTIRNEEARQEVEADEAAAQAPDDEAPDFDEDEADDFDEDEDEEETDPDAA